MWLYVLVFVFQVLFNVFKTMEIKYTYENKVKQLVINSVWINLVALGSTYFALDRLFARDWAVIIVYISGSVFGKWWAMTHFVNYENKFYEFFNKRKTKKQIMGFFMTYYLICLTYCLYMSFKKWNRDVRAGGLGITPGLDTMPNT